MYSAAESVVISSRPSSDDSPKDPHGDAGSAAHASSLSLTAFMEAQERWTRDSVEAARRELASDARRRRQLRRATRLRLSAKTPLLPLSAVHGA